MIVHYRIHWSLKCGHDVVCGCRHRIGDIVWCYICQDYREVITRERIPVEDKTRATPTA